MANIQESHLKKLSSLQYPPVIKQKKTRQVSQKTLVEGV